MLLRLLFPSWAFFDRVTAVPVLQARVMSPHGTFSAWRDVLTAPPRRWPALLYNPRGNAHLALQGVVDRLTVECDEGRPDPTTSALTEAIVERWVRSVAVTPGERVARWQWRVVTHDATGALQVLHEGRGAS